MKSLWNNVQCAPRGRNARLLFFFLYGVRADDRCTHAGPHCLCASYYTSGARALLPAANHHIRTTSLVLPLPNRSNAHTLLERVTAVPLLCMRCSARVRTIAFFLFRISQSHAGMRAVRGRVVGNFQTHKQHTHTHTHTHPTVVQAGWIG